MRLNWKRPQMCFDLAILAINAGLLYKMLTKSALEKLVEEGHRKGQSR
jgi:hypothetical protein